MDIYELLDLTERLLILYGYEVERDFGIEGRSAEVGDLTRETREGVPSETMPGVTYMADIFAEKKDIERPFGRIVVRYNRTQSAAEVSDITHTAQVREAAHAYMGIYLTTTGFTPDAKSHADSNQIRIFTPDDIERLIGKAMATKPWWTNMNAYPVYLTYDEMLAKARHTFTNWFHRSWEVSKMPYQELAYMPYWKFSYSVLERAPESEKKAGLQKFSVSTGTSGLNAHNGMYDIWWDYDPIQLQQLIGSKTHINVGPGYMAGELYMEYLWEPAGTTITKITKPKKFPPGLRFQVYKPAIEKWEAKVAATHWISFFYNTDPKNVMISNLEILYLPWWVYRINHLPYIKNPWREVEWFTIQISPHLTDVFNLWKLREYRRNIVYLMAEKYMVNLLSPRRYVKIMNFITYKLINRIVFFHLKIRPSYRWIDLFFVVLFMAMVYGMLAFKTGLSLLVFIALLFIFIGPGYALLYVTRCYLQHYPWGTEEGRKYTVPQVYRKLTKKLLKQDFLENERKKSLARLEEMYVAGELTGSQKKRLEKYWNERAKTELEKAKALGGG